MRIRELRKYTFVGAVVFWCPDIIVHTIRRNAFSGIDAVCLTVVLPVLTSLALARVWRHSGDTGNFQAAAWAGVLGIWLFGPLLMMVSASFSGGGYTTPDAWQTALLGTALFPIFTFMMSTYDGTLFAVILVTAALPLMSLRLKPGAQTTPLPNAK